MKKILIVDDDSEFLPLIQLPLKKCGYQVSAAQDGTTAVTAIHKGKPDLVILDICLPCGDGVSVLKKIKQSVLTNSIPVIILTSSMDPRHKRESDQMGVEVFLRKPCSPEDLILQIKQLIGESS